MSNWYLQNGKESDVVVSTKVSLNRNLNGFAYVNKLKIEERKKILDLVRDSIPSVGYELTFMNLKDLDNTTKESLVEKGIISQEFANRTEDGYGILINKEENICIMLNEEDHLVIQAFSEGLAVNSLKNLIVEIDKKIDKLLSYEFSKKYGYLTACPINLGTGMKVYTTIHLAGLSKTGNVSKVLRLINKFGMTVRGLNGDSLDTRGNLYQISNTQTLGISEEEIANNVNSITEKVIEQERLARNYLGKTGIELENKLYRSFALLNYSKKLDYDECLELLSDVKLGTDMGIIKEMDDSKVKKLYLYTKPANLQKFLGEVLDDKDSKIKRSEVINSIINCQ